MAGRGLIHNEVPGGGKRAHVFQLWVNLPRAYKLVQAGAREPPGAEIRVFSGQSGSAKASTRNDAPVTMTKVRL